MSAVHACLQGTVTAEQTSQIYGLLQEAEDKGIAEWLIAIAQTVCDRP